ncbi:MAG: ABC transporter substrate-binding protein [Enterocloster bolteae]
MQEARGRRKGTPSKLLCIPTLAGFDPYNSGMDLDKVVYSNIFDCLCRGYYDGIAYEMHCARIDSISEDVAQSITFNLKEGVKFHNGETLTAGDVAFSMMRAKESSEMSNFTKRIS